jgi:hypothetical protein
MPSANVSPIASRLAIILQIPNQISKTMEKNLKLIILCDLKNLGLLGAPRVEPLANLHFFHWWHKTSHMPTSKTLITN